jgi:hypothetical protein
MTNILTQAAVAALVVAGFSGAPAAAFDPLPNLVNLDFSQVEHAPKGDFGYVNPTGWTGGSGLIFIATNDTFAQSAAGPVYLSTYGNPQGAVTGNYVEADGNPGFESGFNYEVTGLNPGQTYTLSFYQGASTQLGFGYNEWTGTNTGTTNQWIVSLADSGMEICYNCGGIDAQFGPVSTYFNADPLASVATSQLMTVPFQGTVGWQYVSVNLTAHSATELLSFLAWGDNGSTINLPPIAFLSGVNSPPGLGVPEPATWALMMLGFGGAGLAIRSRRKHGVIGVA